MLDKIIYLGNNCKDFIVNANQIKNTKDILSALKQFYILQNKPNLSRVAGKLMMAIKKIIGNQKITQEEYRLLNYLNSKEIVNENKYDRIFVIIIRKTILGECYFKKIKACENRYNIIDKIIPENIFYNFLSDIINKAEVIKVENEEILNDLDNNKETDVILNTKKIIGNVIRFKNKETIDTN